MELLVTKEKVKLAIVIGCFFRGKSHKNWPMFSCGLEDAA